MAIALAKNEFDRPVVVRCDLVEEFSLCRRRQWAQRTLEPVGADVVSNDPAHAWFECGGANHQTATQGEAHQRDRVTTEEVQHGFHRLLPFRAHVQVRQFERRPLAGALE